MTLNAKEPQLAILNEISSNDTQRFEIASSSFLCKPYGIVSIEDLYKQSDDKSFCKKSIEDFYTKNRDLRYFTQSILKVYQRYHIEFKKSECIVYAKGQTTLSELLLSKGLAVSKRSFKDKEFKFLFEKVSDTAKRNGEGLWASSIKKDCSSQMQKN